MVVTETQENALLARLDESLERIAREVPDLQAGLLPYVQGGKRLRARLLIALGVRGEPSGEDTLLRYATFVELVHAGGLCHDDVVDGSSTRRGRPSIASAYGIRAAAGAGLFLMVRALEGIAGEDHGVRRWVADAAVRVARGQAQEMMDLYRDDLPIAGYLERASDKTGALFELAGRLGALAGGFGGEIRERLATYGGHVGLAFQIADDLRDLVGGPALGRERGTDIREGVYSLPVLFTLAGKREGGERLRRSMRRARRDKDQTSVDECCDIVMRNGAVAATGVVMRGCVDEARTIADGMPVALRTCLHTIAESVDYGLTHDWWTAV